MSRSRTDRELLETGTGAAFGEIFNRHAPLLRRWLRHETRNGEVAADLVAETFAEAWVGRDRIPTDGEGSALPWLFGVARNLERQSRRRGRVDDRARQRIGMAIGPYDSEPFDPTDEPDLELARVAFDALARLPQSQQGAVRLRVLQELAYPEVARRLDISEANARIRVHRALRAVRSALSGGAS